MLLRSCFKLWTSSSKRLFHAALWVEFIWKHRKADKEKSAQMSSLLFNVLFVCECWATFLPYVALPHLDLVANVSWFDLVCFFWFAKSHKHSPPPSQPDESQRDINIAKYCWLIRKSFQLLPSGVATANWFACLLWHRFFFFFNNRSTTDTDLVFFQTLL